PRAVGVAKEVLARRDRGVHEALLDPGTLGRGDGREGHQCRPARGSAKTTQNGKSPENGRGVQKKLRARRKMGRQTTKSRDPAQSAQSESAGESRITRVTASRARARAT